MEALRTIPEIESKTAGIYYRTVEHIRGYIEQLQRNAEQLLVGIDNQPGIISFTHFARSLSRLKHAEWINRVIPETYDNLMYRITEELVHYAQQSEDRLRKLDLSLKYPENVGVAQEILEKIESMHALECSIPELEKCRTSIFHFFFQSTQRTFDHIQKTFNLQDKSVYQIKQELNELEQIKREYENLHPARVFIGKKGYPDINTLNHEIETLRNEDYLNNRAYSIRNEYKSLLAPRDSISSEETSYLRRKGYHSPELLDQTIQEKKRIIAEREMNKQPYNFGDGLDALAANNALIYVSRCEQVSHVHVKEIAADVTWILKEYICEYGKFLNHEISTKFQHARRIDVEGGPLQYSCDLRMRLYELSSLSKYARVFECMDGAEKVEHWRQQFLEYHHTLSSNMEQHRASGRYKDLKDQLIIAQALSCLDIFCVSVFAGNGFQSLHRQYQIEVWRGIEAACRIVLDYISKRDYANTDMALYDIDDRSLNQRDSAQIKHDLQNSINTLIKDIRSIARWLDGKIERENNRNQIKEIKENIEKIRIALNKNNIMKFLDGETQSRLRSFDNEINETLSGIILRALNTIEVFMNVDSFVEAEQGMENLSWVQHQLAGHYTSSLVTEQTNELRNKVNGLVIEISKRDDFSDINNYFVNPPKDLLAKLKMVASRGDVRFHQAYTSTLAKIRQNFSQAIDKVHVAPFDARSGQIRLLKHALCFLPEELQIQFKLRIDDLGRSFIDEEKKYRRDLEEALRRADEDDRKITKIGEFAQQYKNQNMHELFEILHIEISRKLYAYQTNVETLLDKQDMQLAIDIVKKIVKYRESVGSYISEVEEIYKNVRDLISKSFKHYSDTLAGTAIIEQAQIVEKAFSNMIICIDFSITFDTTPENFLPESVLQYSNERLQNMCEYFDENSKKYRIAISKMNVNELHQVLTIAKRWDGLMQKIKCCRSEHALIINLLQNITNVYPVRRYDC